MKTTQMKSLSMEISDIKGTATMLNKYFPDEILYIPVAQGVAKLQEVKVRRKKKVETVAESNIINIGKRGSTLILWHHKL